MRLALLTGSFALAAIAGILTFQPKVPQTPSRSHSNGGGGLHSFEIVPLETVSETSWIASISGASTLTFPESRDKLARLMRSYSRVRFRTRAPSGFDENT